MRDCIACGISLIHSKLISRNLPADEVIEYLTCDGCGHNNIVTGWIDPRLAYSVPGYLLYNERTNLFDEYDNDGVLIRANAIYCPWEILPRPCVGIWPAEKRKPERAGNETRVNEFESRGDGGEGTEDRLL